MTRNGVGCNLYVEACNAINLPLLDLLQEHRVRIEHFECNILLPEAAGFDVGFAPPAMALPIELAALGGHVAVLELLHKKGARYPDSLLKDAVARQQVAVVEQLLETGADPAKADIDTLSGLASLAMMDLLMHASALAADKETGLPDGAILRARPAECVPLLRVITRVQRVTPLDHTRVRSSPAADTT